VEVEARLLSVNRILLRAGCSDYSIQKESVPNSLDLNEGEGHEENLMLRVPEGV
jgi:hypothetical protein